MKIEKIFPTPFQLTILITTGKIELSSEFFQAIITDAALATGILHRKEVPIAEVKKHLQKEGSKHVN
jgi:imidazole glycerol phosphate synthase subunit HisF